MSPPKPVAVAADQRRDKRGAREQRGENDPDFSAGEAAAREADTDQHGAEPVGKCAGCLGRNDAAGVRAQLRSS